MVRKRLLVGKQSGKRRRREEREKPRTLNNAVKADQRLGLTAKTKRLELSPNPNTPSESLCCYS